MNIEKELFQKYNVAVPRYTSYPPANFFHKDFSQEKCIEFIKASNSENTQNISFYIHIPFCSNLCYYCGCNTIISRNKTKLKTYVESLKKEIFLLKKYMNPERKVSQIHWGGGTPNYLSKELVKDLMQVFDENFEFIENPEIAMECHPAHLTFEYVDALAENKFNRISLGIQDFNSEVLKAVNREESKLPVKDLVNYIKAKNISVNLDFIYGLPFQEEENFKKTIEKAVELSADRLVTFSYAHVPWVKKVQKKLEKFDLPDVNKKTKLFDTALSLLTQNGYYSIGLDHFAKKNDELYKALETKTLHRNFQGYCTLETTGQVYALGVSGISQLNNAYLQNTKELSVYTEAIEKGHFPVEKAYFLNKEEKITRQVIETLMCNLFLDWNKVAKNHNSSVKEIKNTVNYSVEKLKDFESEKLLTFDENTISVNKRGQYFIRNIVSIFDPKLAGSGKRFSKAL